jgi:hypothetical protein
MRLMKLVASNRALLSIAFANTVESTNGFYVFFKKTKSFTFITAESLLNAIILKLP